jgi:hypothetical protein
MLTSKASFAALVLLAPGSRQDADNVVDALIERTNGLKSFVANYRILGRSNDAEPRDITGNLRLVYRAPEDLLVEFETEGMRLRSAIAGGIMSVLVEKEGGPFKHGEAELGASGAEPRERIARVFHENFPALGDVGAAPSPEVFVRFQVKPATDSERPMFHLDAGTGRGDEPLLNWLGQLKESGAALAAEGDLLVWDAAEGIRMWLQKGSGFIERIDATYRGKTKRGLELVDLVLDCEIEDALFRSPEVDPSAEDISESVGLAWEIPNLMTTCGLVYRKIREGVEGGTLEWTGEARARLGKVLQAYHTELAPRLSTEMTRSSRASVDKFCEWYQETRRNAAGHDEVEDMRVDWDERFRDGMDSAVESYLLRAVPESANASAIRVDARTLELEAATAAFRKSVVDPILEYYDAQMELANRGELPPATK